MVLSHIKNIVLNLGLAKREKNERLAAEIQADADMNVMDISLENLSRENIFEDLIIVHQFGRVASNTVFFSLHDKGFKVYHSHYLSDEAVSQMESCIRESAAPNRYVKDILNGIYHYKALRYCLLNYYNDASPERNKVRIITGVRDPIGHLISLYFFTFQAASERFVIKRYGEVSLENIKAHFLDCVNCYLEIYNNQKDEAESYKEFLEKYKDADIRHFTYHARLPFVWFDREVKPFFEIDVFAEPFPHHTGCKVYNSSHAKMLLIRLENFRKVAGKQLCEFVQKDIEIIDGSFQPTHSHLKFYRQFVSEIKFPREFVNLQHSSKVARHFYSAGELKKFSRKWLAR